MQVNGFAYGLNNYYHTISSNDDKRNLENQQDEQKQDSNQNNEQTQMVNGVALDSKELQVLRELQDTDRNVKAHEAAHQAAGGGLTGPASFSYTRGPDNQMYAIAGEVPIRVQKGNTPEETIAIARQIIAAAMAPSDPSPQDYKVAANATKMEIEARAEAVKMKAEEADANNDKETKTSETDENNNTNEEYKSSIADVYKRNSMPESNPILSIAS
ncbi:putative metalloprotease CJM1_0395 family protein [Campylobacter cuniculorum]|uniref:putative metalloprotease CJM1_0395 family protein n=1 Tax=Campylobacter cuniculorum TaxID=374106 RepID=UPI0023F44E5F|nr:putative metalloprotease CJM1_0395 family protein [Campylobacter cuniculorum]